MKVIAKTKKGQIIEITPVFNEKKEGVEYRTSHNDNEIIISKSDFAVKDGHFCLHINKYQVSNLLGVEMPAGRFAAIVIETPNAKEMIWDVWPEQHRKMIEDIIEKEIASMSDYDPVTLYAFSGYGMHYTLESEKLSYRASRRVSVGVKEIMNMFPTEPAPEKQSNVAYKVVMTWGEYVKIRNEREEKEEKRVMAKKLKEKQKFEEAKNTGKPVLLYSEIVDEEDLPRHLREEDSSLATVSVFAMPDGTKSEKIVHAH